MQLKGKRIIVTGGSSGVAAETVRAFAVEGASVVSLDINDADGEVVAKEAASATGAKVLYRHCDITKRSEVDDAFAFAVESMGGLDSLFMIAGDEYPIAYGDIDEDDIQRGMAVHVTGTILTNQAAFKYLKEAGGAIVNYSSYAGIDGMPGMPVYSAAKGAVATWTRTVAKDWGQYWIRVNTVCPSVMTPLAQKWYDDMDPERRAAIDAWTQANMPLGGGLGDVRDVASVNVFLASDASRFMTGQLLGVDGGATFPR